MLSHFSVKNYKCLADVSLPLTPIHVLIGQNDTGKTSLLEAIRAVGEFASLASHARKPLEDTNVVISNPKETLKRAFPGEWKHEELLWRGGGSVINLAMDTHDRKDKDTRWTFACEVPFGTNDLIVPFHFGSNILTVPAPLRIDAMKFRPKAMALPTALLTTAQYRMDEDGFGLASLLDAIKDYDTKSFEHLQDQFSYYFPRYRRIRLETARGWTRNTQGGWATETRSDGVGKQVWLVTSGGDIRLQQASDGAILLLGFLAAINSPTPPHILLVEEPENGIHPMRLIEIAKLLREFVSREKNAPQIILTTHSPYLLSEFQPDEVTLMRRQEDGSAKAFPLRNAPHIKERMGAEFYLGELWYNLSEEELLA